MERGSVRSPGGGLPCPRSHGHVTLASASTLFLYPALPVFILYVCSLSGEGSEIRNGRFWVCLWS